MQLLRSIAGQSFIVFFIHSFHNVQSQSQALPQSILTATASFIGEEESVTLYCSANERDHTKQCYIYWISPTNVRNDIAYECQATFTGSELLALTGALAEVKVQCFYLVSRRLKYEFAPHSNIVSITVERALPQSILTATASSIGEEESVTFYCSAEAKDRPKKCYIYWISPTNHQNNIAYECQATFTGSALLALTGALAEVKVRCFYTVSWRLKDEFAPQSNIVSITVERVVTGSPTSASPTSTSPTSASPTTASPTSASPTSASPTTASPTSASPTSASPTTASPTSASPTTASPTSASPTTASPTSASPTSASPTSASPTTASPTSASPTSASPTSATAATIVVEPNSVVTGSPTSTSPTSASPTSASPTSASPTTASPTSASPMSASPTSASPTSASPTSAATTIVEPNSARLLLKSAILIILIVCCGVIVFLIILLSAVWRRRKKNTMEMKSLHTGSLKVVNRSGSCIKKEDVYHVYSTISVEPSSPSQTLVYDLLQAQ